MIIGVLTLISIISLIFWIKKMYLLNLNILYILRRINNNFDRNHGLDYTNYTPETFSTYLDDTSEDLYDDTLPIVRPEEDLEE